MTDLTVLIPVLNRPWRVQALLRSLADSFDGRDDVRYEPLFLCTRGDDREIAAIREHDALYEVIERARGFAEYPIKINEGAKLTTSEWLLLGADDLQFKPGWLDEALAVHEQTSALVIGTQDEGNQLVLQGRHSTHPLIHRSYVGLGTIDNTGVLLHEGYDHNACDVECCEVAMFRGVWAFADKCVIRHDHPLWSRGKVQRDETYRKGMRNAGRDRALLNQRRRLWKAKPDPPPQVAYRQRRVMRARAPISDEWPPR